MTRSPVSAGGVSRLPPASPQTARCIASAPCPAIGLPKTGISSKRLRRFTRRTLSPPSTPFAAPASEMTAGRRRFHALAG